MKLFVATLLISTIVFVAWFYLVLPSMKLLRILPKVLYFMARTRYYDFRCWRIRRQLSRMQEETERRLEILREVRRTNQRSIRRIALLSKYAKATNHY